MTLRIACIHQGYELYGSDRSFVESVKALRVGFPTAAITVVLPRGGPIVDLLRGVANEVVFEPIWVLRRQGALRLATVGLARLVPATVRALRRFRQADLVYINTCVIADYLLAARLFPQKALLHVHEIPEGAARMILRRLVRASGAEVIFNSKATAAVFGPGPGGRSRVIYNGVPGPREPELMTYDGTRPLRVLMLGRINRIKGQEVLLEAVASLPAATAGRIVVRIVGNAFESVERERELGALVDRLGLADRVTTEPFLADPAPLYRWADVVVVPSRRPESLGRVAIEAMAFGRPVVASAIGGLQEVVEDGRTGWLVPPGDAPALAARLASLIEDAGTWADRPAAGRARYEALFAEAIAAKAIVAVARAKLGARVATAGATLRPSVAVDER